MSFKLLFHSSSDSRHSEQCFVTTPIFYANGEPHLGHAYTGVVADVLHRFNSISGVKSHLITGTDEHGQKIANTAQANQQSPEQFVEKTSRSFRNLWPQLDINPDVFIRTTADQHKANIERVWRTLEQKGDIYLGHYSGDYCVACEQFYPERDLLDGLLCPIHKQPITRVEEKTYLFQLEKYRLALLEYYQNNPDVVVPQHYQNTLIEQLASEPLEDLSISRINNQWGIKVPSNQEHTVYVWIDALFSYITAIAEKDADVSAIERTEHVIGKDILLFHAVYWPAFLLALELPLPKKLIVHGWWTIGGEKISKSNPLTTVNPSSFAQRLSTDGIRYALIRQKPLYRDGNVELEEFTGLINGDLLNNFANLVKRNHTIVVKEFSGSLTLESAGRLDSDCRTYVSEFSCDLERIVSAYHDRDLYRVTKECNALLSKLNAFFHHRAPWLIRKGQLVQESQQTCLIVCNFVRELAWLLSPIVPELCQNIITELSEQPSSHLNASREVLKSVEVVSSKSHLRRLSC